MTRYYDQPTTQCEDCYYHQPGAFPNGNPYWACRYQGYILHYDKPVIDEHCDGHATPAQYEQQQALKKLQKRQRRKK